MKPETDDGLEKFYNNIYIACEKEKKVKKIVDDSIIKTLLGLTSNNRYSVLNNSALPSYKIDRRSLENLLKKGFIRGTDNAGHYTITAKGLWDVETKKNVLNESSLIEFLDEKKFNPYKSAEKPLVKKEKIILFFMIAAKAFSEKSAIDTKKGEIAETKLKEVIDKSAEKLASMEFIPKIENESDIYGEVGNEPPGGGILLRRVDELPKKIGGIYKSPGERRYYLDLYDGKIFSKDKLKFLFKKIFGDRILTPEQVNELYSFF